MNRLGVVDEIFLRTHRGMGTPIALQGIWRTAAPVEPELLRAVHAALRTGPLGRRVVRARVPGARPFWRVNHRAHPLRLADEPVADLLTWADGQGDGLDPETGPGWRLSVATLADGSGAVALTCSHVLADGRGLIHAIDLALRRVREPLGERAVPGTIGPDGSSALGRVPRSDWADAVRQWRLVLGGTSRALRRGLPAPPAAVAARSAAAAGPEFVPPGAVLRISAPDWDTAAAAHGGTPNSLFVRAVADMLWDSGFSESTMAVSLPVDTRDEPRIDNDLAMTDIVLTRADTPATIREKCRAAYEHRMTSPGGLPEEILQVIPDRLAHRLSRGAGERDILCSNLGTLPDTLAALGPHGCTGVAARAIHPGLRVAALPRTRLSAYLSRLGDTYSLALVGLDPEHTATPAALRELGLATLARLGLDAVAW
ncbi:hypothetical protein [Nocardia stercoris]|uniref:Condensation domain-containing protein n=1 Tax=Nocardia stercoris TaxID=2483361 RepID=A0A3M2KR72_9NOCA|nr:hypothetical protein [Nocardia stercoris]RMI28147.1 hypothetical protein EBN03_31650 [Nocardia stercoris]